MSDAVLLNQLMADYAQSTGVGPLQPDPAGLVALSFNDKLVLHIGPGQQDGEAVFYARLGPPLPQEHAAELMSQMLEANLLSNDAGGGTLALDARDGAPMLVQRIRLQGLSAIEFGQVIADMAQAGQDWADFLSAEQGAEAVDPPMPVGQGSSFIRA